jgi:RNA polymerase I-associated factor PAF67
MIDDPPKEPVQRHLSLFLSDVRAQAPVPTLRSFLKLYTSLDAKKLANFLDADEEEMVQQMMVMKQASRSISRVGNDGSLLDGQTISTSDLNFVIDEVCRGFSRLSVDMNMLFKPRIWYTSRNRLSGDAMLGGLLTTLSGHNAFSTKYGKARCRRLQKCLHSRRLHQKHPPRISRERERRRWLGVL